MAHGLNDPDWMKELEMSAHYTEELLNRIELCLRQALKDSSLRKVENALEGVTLLRKTLGLKEMS